MTYPVDAGEIDRRRMGGGVRVLLIDRDERWGALAQSVLGANGVSIVLSVDAPSAVQRLGAQRWDALLVDADLWAESGLAYALTGWRAGAPGAIVVVLSGGTGPGAAVADALAPARVLRKPVSLLDLEALLRSAPPRSAASGVARLGALGASAVDTLSAPMATPLPLLGVEADPLRQLARLWAERGTAAVSAKGTEAVLVRGGGLVDAAGWAVLPRLLAAGGSLMIESAPQGPSGDWAGLGMALLHHARTVVAPGAIQRHRFDTLALGSRAELVRAVPVHPAVAALLDRPGTPIGRWCNEVPPSAQTDLAALLRLGLVQVVPASAEALRHAEPSLRPAPTPPVRPASPPSVPPRTVPPPTVPPRSAFPGDSPSAVTQPPSVHRTDPGTLRPEGRPRPAGAPAWREMHRRLTDDVERLRAASPWVVLGLPNDAAVDLRDATIERQRARYAGLAARADVPAGIQALAREMLSLVDEAARRVVASHSSVTVDETPTAHGAYSPEERLLAVGRDLARRGQFAQAEGMLTRAQERAVGNPLIAAWLGWARLHNPERAPEERAEEGRDLILMAAQLAPDDPEVTAVLVRFLLRAGDPAGALARAQRGLRASPDHPELRAAWREARQAAPPPEPPR